MSCEARLDDLMLLAAGQLPAEDEAPLRRHLASGCPRCVGALAEANAVLAQLALATEPVAPSPERRARLLARATSSAAPGAASVPPRTATRRAPPRPRSRRLAPLAASAALAAGLAAFATYLGVSTPLVRERDAALAEGQRLARAVELRDDEIRRLAGEAARQAETVRMLRSPEVQVVPLRGGAQPDATGRLFFDRARRRWYLHASGLRPAGPGKTYELWLVDAAQQKIPAGLFDVDEQGEATIEVAVPETSSGFALAAVTDEPAGGVPQPTGQIQLVGEL